MIALLGERGRSGDALRHARPGHAAASWAPHPGGKKARGGTTGANSQEETAAIACNCLQEKEINNRVWGPGS